MSVEEGKNQVVDMSNARVVPYMDVDKKRWELGKDAAEKGQRPHDEPSEEFRSGYKRGLGFGLNVMPRRFGAGRDERADWVCGGCGNANRRYLTQCYLCGVHRSYTKEIEGQDEI